MDALDNENGPRYSLKIGEGNVIHYKVTGEAKSERAKKDVENLNRFFQRNGEGISGARNGQRADIKPVKVQSKLSKNVRRVARIFNKRVVFVEAGGVGMKRLLVATTILLFFTSFVYSAPVVDPQDKYHCKDQASWQEWHALLEKHPDDDSIYTLYALRLGLCSMVETGNIDKDRAVRIFEDMRGAVIRQQEEREPAGEDKKEGA